MKQSYAKSCANKERTNQDVEAGRSLLEELHSEALLHMQRLKQQHTDATHRSCVYHSNQIFPES